MISALNVLRLRSKQTALRPPLTPSRSGVPSGGRKNP